MTLEYVNILYVESLERGLDGVEDVLPREAPLIHQTEIIRLPPSHEVIYSHFSIRKGRKVKLCYDDEGLAWGVDLLKGFAEDDFGLAT